MNISARLLGPGDEKLIDGFLAPHTQFAFFMRSNIRKGGLRFEGKPLQAEYFGAFDSGKLVGILAHGWMSNVQIFSPCSESVPALVEAWRVRRVRQPREIDVFLGPADHVKELFSSMGIDASALRYRLREEGLYTLSLEKMVMPPLLQKKDIEVRHARSGDAELLTAWRHDFFVEDAGCPPGQETYEKAKAEITRRIDDDGDLYVLEDNKQPVSFCGVGGFLSDWTNVGPVWTPPDKRNLGYARAVLAGALSMQKEKGFTHAVLFAGRAEALKAYTSIGFTCTGDWVFDSLVNPVDRPSRTFRRRSNPGAQRYL